jgi:hypothetical protein
MPVNIADLPDAPCYPLLYGTRIKEYQPLDPDLFWELSG